jgi:hypothetical protein
MREFVWVTADADEPLLPVLGVLGWDERVCFATDFPHADGAGAGAVDAVRRIGLAPDVEAGVLGVNALALYGDRLARRMREGWG